MPVQGWIMVAAMTSRGEHILKVMVHSAPGPTRD